MSYTFLAAAGFGNHRRLLEAILGHSEMTTEARWVFSILSCQKTTHKQKIKGRFWEIAQRKYLHLKKKFKSAIFEVVVIIDSLNIASLEAWLLTGNTHQDW